MQCSKKHLYQPFNSWDINAKEIAFESECSNCKVHKLVLRKRNLLTNLLKTVYQHKYGSLSRTDKSKSLVRALVING